MFLSFFRAVGEAGLAPEVNRLATQSDQAFEVVIIAEGHELFDGAVVRDVVARITQQALRFRRWLEAGFSQARDHLCGAFPEGRRLCWIVYQRRQLEESAGRDRPGGTVAFLWAIGRDAEIPERHEIVAQFHPEALREA